MKVRTDFVTNSSSSSFILSFKDENSIYQTLNEEFPIDIIHGYSYGDDGYFHQLLDEIKNEKRMTEEDIKEFIIANDWETYWNVLKQLEEQGMKPSDARAFLKTEDGEKKIQEAYQDIFDKLMKQIGEDKIIVKVVHGSGGNGEDGMLEMHILPTLNCTKMRFSHH